MHWLITWMITSLIFFPEKELIDRPENYGFDYEEVHLQTKDGIELFAWWLQAPEEKAALLFFHGNAGNISGRLYKAKGWVDRVFSVLLVDYRGYGKSAGKINSGEDLLRDARAAFRWLTGPKGRPEQKVVLYGESLGSHPAIRLAGEHQAAALILEAPYTSFVDLAHKHYPLVPGLSALLGDFAFPNVDYIDKVRSPVFIIHGTEDEVCPYSMGETLMAKAPEPKGIYTIPGGVHNDLPLRGGADYWDQPARFVTSRL